MSSTLELAFDQYQRYRLVADVLASPALAPRVRRAWIEKKAGLSDHAPVWVEVDDE